WPFSNGNNATGLNRIEAQLPRSCHHRVIVGSWIQPYFRNPLFGELFDNFDAHVTWHVHRCDVDRTRDIEHGGVRGMPFDLALVRVDGEHRESSPLVRTQCAIAELISIARCADDGDDLCHES